VAILVVLLPASENDPLVQPAAAEELARVGVTRVDVVRDDRSVALVVEGWSFDPHRSADAVVSAVGGRGGRVRTLHAVMHLAVSPALALDRLRGD
jgi:hypothetical protein